MKQSVEAKRRDDKVPRLGPESGGSKDTGLCGKPDVRYKVECKLHYTYRLTLTVTYCTTWLRVSTGRGARDEGRGAKGEGRRAKGRYAP